MPTNTVCENYQSAYNAGYGITAASDALLAHIAECDECTQAFDDGLEAQRRALGIDEVNWDELRAPANWLITMTCCNTQKARETGRSGLRPDAELQAHLEVCATCREAYDQAQETFQVWYADFGDDCL